jgi:LuxR family maltose regulon positive regulatory protein
MITTTSRDTPQRLPRPGLLALLDHSRDFSLTLVQASAGSGKSTLLKQWQQRLEAPLASLSLSRRDQEPARFFRRLGEALRAVVPGIDSAAYNNLSAAIDLPAETVAESLLEALLDVEGELFILIDDFHHASHALIQTTLALLLEQLPPQVHVVIGSRNHPGFSLSRLKLEDRLLLIDDHDLRLTAREVGQLGAELGLPALDAPAVEALLAVTQGWVAGIKMALLAQAGAERLNLDGLDGSQPELVDYFAHAVLNELHPALRQFLLHSAVFESFSIDLCELVLGLRDAAGLLEQAQRQSLFIQALEDSPGSYRYHPLFQHFLHGCLRREQPALLCQLHTSAARHFLATGDEEAALHHARQSKQPELVTTLLRQCGERWMRQGKFMAIIRTLEPVPEPVLHQDPGLFLPLVGALILSRRFNQARYHLDAISEGSGMASATAPERAQLAFMEEMLQLFQHDSVFWAAFARGRIEVTPHHDIRAFSLAMQARYHLQTGDCTAALEQAQQAKTVLEQIGHEYLASFADIIMILADRHRGDMFSARANGIALYERHAGKPHTPCWVNAGTAMAVINYEQNRLDEAQTLLEELITVVDSACATENVLNVYLTLARLLHRSGQHSRATRLLGQLRRLLKLGNYEFFMSQLDLEALRQAIERRQHSTIEQIVVEQGLLLRLAAGRWAEPGPYDEAWIFDGLATALYLRHRERWTEAEQVLAALSATVHRQGMRARAAVIDANRLVLRYLQGNEHAAIKALLELIDTVGLQCISRSTYDEAPGLAEVMARAVAIGALVLPDIYLHSFQSLLEPETSGEAQAISSQRLTLKEREVLELLRRGLSNKDISRRINISVSTTKWHLKNIFAKLGVSSRTSAMLAGPQGDLQAEAGHA